MASFLPALNQRLATERKPVVHLREAPEQREDEDLIEMLNAGRVAGLRKEAAKRGLDPNVWFHNGEYVAAEKIGAETVTDVANIFKYSIAYRLIQESQQERQKARQEFTETPPPRGASR